MIKLKPCPDPNCNSENIEFLKADYDLEEGAVISGPDCEFETAPHSTSDIWLTPREGLIDKEVHDNASNKEAIEAWNRLSRKGRSNE